MTSCGPSASNANRRNRVASANNRRTSAARATTLSSNGCCQFRHPQVHCARARLHILLVLRILTRCPQRRTPNRTPLPSMGPAIGTAGHGHGHGGDVRGSLPSIFRPHSHDGADSVDSALEASADGVRAVKISLVALLGTGVLQAIVVALTGSVALLADTIHNFSDALTALPLWIAFVLGRRAATRRYTYGYGRAEDLASVFIVAMPAKMSRSAASFIPNRSPKSASSSPPERPSSPAAMLRSIADPAMLRDTDPARHLPRPTRDLAGPSRSRARRRSRRPSSLPSCQSPRNRQARPTPPFPRATAQPPDLVAMIGPTLQ